MLPIKNQYYDKNLHIHLAGACLKWLRSRVWIEEVGLFFVFGDLLWHLVCRYFLRSQKTCIEELRKLN